MKRIHFTAEDLARTRVAPTIGVAAETFDSVRMLGNRDAGLAFRGWQVSVRGRLGEGAGPLAALMPARGPLVDAMSLMGAAPSIDEAVDTWMAAPRALLRVELEHIGFHPAHRTWARGLLDGAREARLQVASALRACHRVTVAPYWNGVRSHLDEARAGYVRAMADGGVERLLTGLGGSAARWRPPVLEVAHARDEDVHLNGRGLVIAPTMFSTGQIELLFPPLDPSRPPTLAVPAPSLGAPAPALWEGGGESAVHSLDDLLGRTRAAVLRAAVAGRRTTELARVLGISPATATHHTAALRNARLLATRREGRAAVHTVTSLGLALLGGRPVA
ncbi:helix-turn-helix domain-containing protein [Streptomyces sp. NBC_01178]|uniref:helix-turn-helix domain-containing protein n=1 Tax=Streptomyces sp. NBC_01178 TaxID=2903762 RepID=UPI00386A4343|nr:helix-turn-helix domain-containing protein [Streptomyces sp. NBC_01178]